LDARRANGAVSAKATFFSGVAKGNQSFRETQAKSFGERKAAGFPAACEGRAVD
jgi:hypothetical protein